MIEQSAGRRRCSWPAVIFLPLVVLMLIPTCVKCGNVEQIRFTYAFVGLFFLRWLIAIIRGERNRDWLFYLFLLIAVPVAIYGLSELIAGQ